MRIVTFRAENNHCEGTVLVPKGTEVSEVKQTFLELLKQDKEQLIEDRSNNLVDDLCKITECVKIHEPETIYF